MNCDTRLASKAFVLPVIGLVFSDTLDQIRQKRVCIPAFLSDGMKALRKIRNRATFDEDAVSQFVLDNNGGNKCWRAGFAREKEEHRHVVHLCDDGQRLVHEPVRLNVFIAAPLDAISGIIERNAGARDLVDNRWQHLFGLPQDRRINRYLGDLGWESVL